jgi:hypothetical protein
LVEDSDLLEVIAANLAPLLELIAPPPARGNDGLPNVRAAALAGIPARTPAARSGGARPGARASPPGNAVRLDRRLGRGGFGTVYAASTPRSIVRCRQDDPRRPATDPTSRAASSARRGSPPLRAPERGHGNDFGMTAVARALLVMELLEGPCRFRECGGLSRRRALPSCAACAAPWRLVIAGSRCTATSSRKTSCRRRTATANAKVLDWRRQRR